MSSGTSPTLTLEIRWSPQRWLLALIPAGCCLLLPWLIPGWRWGVRLGLSAASLLFVAFQYYRAGWWGAGRIARVTWQQSGEWLLQRADDKTQSASLCDDSYISAWLLSLRWQQQGNAGHLILLRSELNNDEWRQWQARLRLEAGRAHASALDSVE